MIWPTPEQASSERPIRATAQLLVEGHTPEMFFRELVQDLELGEQIDVRTFGSINALKPWIEVFAAKAPFKEKVKSVAIVRDAETGPARSAFQSVCSTLSGSGLPVPSELKQFTRSALRVGIYILPDCDRPGTLESLCLEAAAECEVNSPTKFLACVDQFFQCVGAATRFEKPMKARFAAYALARGVVDPQLGRAAQKRIIPCEAKVFAPLVEFLKQLAA